MPVALYALAAGAFGIGITEFVIMGLLLEVGADLGVSTSKAGLLISGYALGVVFGAPLLTIATARWNQRQVLLPLMAVFVVGNVACALAPTYSFLMAARVLTALAHGTFFGVGSVVATRLVPNDKRASAVALMFTGLTLATVLGVPFGTWLGQISGWRSTFWAVALIGIGALTVMAQALPRSANVDVPQDWKSALTMLARIPVVLGLLTTVFGYAGVFTVFTYIAPLLTPVAGFRESAISPILLLFGGGLVIGNVVGGRLADRWLVRSVMGSLGALTVVLLILGMSLGSELATLFTVTALGVAAFATVPPLQIWVLAKAKGVGESLASSFNIAAFNLGNALGAFAGGWVIDHGPGLIWVTWIAAGFPLIALATASATLRLDVLTHSQPPQDELTP